MIAILIESIVKTGRYCLVRARMGDATYFWRTRPWKIWIPYQSTPFPSS